MDDAGLREYIAEIAELNRQARIAEGLPPERPEDFVDETLSFALCLTELQPFIKIAVKYARIISEGGYFTIDTSKFEKYVRYAELLSFSKIFAVTHVASGVSGMIFFMDSINTYLEQGAGERSAVSDILSLSLYTQLMEIPSNFYYDYTQPDIKHMARIRKDVTELLSDPERLQAETDTAFAHYESIKHLI